MDLNENEKTPILTRRWCSRPSNDAESIELKLNKSNGFDGEYVLKNVLRAKLMHNEYENVQIHKKKNHIAVAVAVAAVARAIIDNNRNISNRIMVYLVEIRNVEKTAEFN